MSSNFEDEGWGEAPSSANSGQWESSADWSADSKGAESQARDSRNRDFSNPDRPSGWRNNNQDARRKPQNSFWKHDDRNFSTRGARGNYSRPERSSDNVWHESREFTNSSRYSNSRDSKPRFSDRKSMNDLQSGFARISVNSSDVGKIIGKGGSKIRELQDESGCRINIIPSDNQPETEVELRGTEENQQRAKDLIESFLSNFSNRQRSDRVPPLFPCSLHCCS